MKKGHIFLIGTIVLCSVIMGLVFSSKASSTNQDAHAKKKVETNVTKKDVDEKSPGLTVESNGDIETIYSDIQSLTKEADVIFEGEVLSTKTKYYKDITIPSTVSQVKVVKATSGNIRVGDVLTFEEIGGFTTQKYVKESSGRDFPLSKSEEKQPVEFKVNGISAMKNGEKVILFGGKNKDETYSVIGVYQGKFRIEGDIIQRVVPKGDEGMYSSLQMNQASLEKEVNQFKK
ncbi:hypothetical protein J2Z48_002118 [Croceifilum oryzae]|uniref:Uncharacterized protein n=1 Tax=Croceifilum oryzae TaxID=1553429 RepID=A0AAJ1TKS4_9BACL|nr:hypothetical protein [Croceifilum oryzae]MDQ0417934.1 hypothetical protein [Croceifilum oryzae]